MNKKSIRHIAVFCLLTALTAFSMLGQDYKVLIGKWSMTSETSGDSLNWTLLLKESDGKLAASLVSEEGEIPAKDVSYADGVLKFKAPYQDQDYDIELKLTADKLDGTWSGNGDSGKTSGTRL